jgi:predicted permease
MVTITGREEPERVRALGVTHDVLSVLGVTPLLGRSFTRADDAPESPATVMLTYGYWRDKFGGDRSAIDRTIAVNGKPHTIIGVLPQQFRFVDGTPAAVLLPMQFDRAGMYLGNYIYKMIARLKPGVTLAQANADVARMISIVFRSFGVPPGYSVKVLEDRRLAPNLRPLKDEVVGDVDKVLWVLMAGIGLVLVVACANLVHLVLVRANHRQQELAIRAALGATRRRVAAELFVESLILAVLGGLLGLAVAYGVLRVLLAIAPSDLPRVSDIRINGSVVLFTLAVSLFVSVLFGSATAFRHAAAGSGTGLRQRERSTSESRERRRSGSVLVVVQVALAVVLLVGSGLMIRTFHLLTTVNPGFVAPAEVQTFRIHVPEAQVQAPERVARLYEEIRSTLQALPGVTSVGLSRNLPMDGSNWNSGIFVEGGTSAPDQFHRTRYNFVAPGYFKTLGTPILAGRDITWSDIHSSASVVLVSERLAREHWQNAASALGKRIRGSAQGAWQEVVGVVRDIREDGVDKEPPASIYWGVLIATSGGEKRVIAVRREVAFVIRSPRAGSEELMNEVRRAVWSVDSSLPVAEANPLDYYYMKSMARRSFTLGMLGVAAAMALLLGIAGLYGVIAYSVSRRRREMGIRLALGAQANDVRRLVVHEGLKLSAVGVAIGTVAALASTRYLATLLYGVTPTDPPTFVAVALLLMTVAIVASYIPAQQGAKLDPAVALRED